MGNNARSLRHKLQRNFHNDDTKHTSQSHSQSQSSTPQPPQPLPPPPTNSDKDTSTSNSERVQPTTNPLIKWFTNTFAKGSISENDASSFRNRTLYAATQQVDHWLMLNAHSNPHKATVLDAIAKVPTAVWLDDTKLAGTHVRHMTRNASKRNEIYQLVLRGSPELTVEKISLTKRTYLTFIQSVANNLAKSDGILILEPGLLHQVSSWSAEIRDSCLGLIHSAIRIISARSPLAKIYIDVGRPNCMSAAHAAMFLKIAGVTEARGFSLNVGHSESTRDCLMFAQSIRLLLGNNIHFVVDTALNGNTSSASQNTQRIGELPMINTCTDDDPLLLGADALLWVTPPGVAKVNFNSASQNSFPIGKFSVDLAITQIGNNDD